MNLTNNATVIFVKDIAISKNFYHNLLGLEIEFDFGKNIIFKGGIAIWEINSIHIIPTELGDGCISSSSNRFELCFETEDLDESYITLKDSTITFLHEIHEENWGQFTIRFFDPDNHLIEIGESLHCFVKRMLDSGMTLEQVSAKTGISIVDFEKILSSN